MANIFTKLEAVNRVLRAGGEHPVSSLNSGSGDSILSEAMLNEVSYETQATGQVCNTEFQDLVLNSSNEVELPDNLLHFEAVNNNKMLIQRGAGPIKVYNVTDQTFDLSTIMADGTLRAKLVLGLAFDELPFALKMWITDEAAQRYQMLVRGDASIDQTLMRIYGQSRIRGRAQDIRQRQLNLFGNMRSILPWIAAKQTRRRGWGGGESLRFE